MPGSVNETRMLERRVSNNRSDLDGDQKMNYFLSWFNQWSDLQKSDFVTVLADTMSSSATSNGGCHDEVADGLTGLSISSSGNKKPPSLFDCQVKLFRDWFQSWSDDQKNYLVMRLRDIDANFFSRFEDRMTSGGRTPPEKDYFEPGVPDDLVRPSHHSDNDSGVFNSSVHAKLIEVSEEEEQRAEHGDDDNNDVFNDDAAVGDDDEDEDPALKKLSNHQHHDEAVDNGIDLDTMSDQEKDSS